MSAPVKRTLIVYGNCQAQAVTAVLEKDPIASSLFRVVYVRSYDHPAEGALDAANEDIASCALLFEQHDRRAFPFRDRLPADAKVIKFPSVDLSVLWPFNSVNRYSVPEPPVFPFGRFPYGDRVILNCIDSGMGVDETVEYYLTSWDDYAPDLGRLFQVETARVKARDARCDVKMSDVVFNLFGKKRMFWTVNHPTPEILTELIERLVHAAGIVNPVLSDVDVEATMQAHFGPRGPLGIVNIPVHPKVAEFYELSWYDYNQPNQNFDLTQYTYEEYFRAFAAHADAMRRAGTLVAEPAQP